MPWLGRQTMRGSRTTPRPPATLRRCCAWRQQAAKQASSLGAHREGAAQCARALRFANRLPPVERAELLEQQALDCMLTDQIDEAIDMTRVALAVRAAVGDARAQSRTLLMLSNVLWCPGHVAESFAAAREAARVLDGLEPGSELALAFARLSQLSMDAEDLEESVAWGTRALELATALDHTEIYIHALISVRAARCLAGDPRAGTSLSAVAR